MAAAYGAGVLWVIFKTQGKICETFFFIYDDDDLY